MFQDLVPDASPRRKWLVPLALLLATGTLLGISTNLAKLAGDAGLAPMSFLMWSVLGAALVLGGVEAIRGRFPSLNARTLEYFVVAGLVGVAAPNLLFFAAVPRVGASFVALAIAFPPLFTYLGALLLGMETFQARRAGGVALALGGAAVLAIYKLTAPDANAIWIIATLSGPILLAVGNIYRTARWPEGAKPDELAPGMLAASALMLLSAGLVAWAFPNTSSDFSFAVPTHRAAPVLIVLAQVATFSVQFFLFFILQKRGGPVYLSLLGSVGAVVGVPIAVLLLGEALPQGLAVGGVLIALGIWLLTFGGAKTKETHTIAPCATVMRETDDC